MTESNREQNKRGKGERKRIELNGNGNEEINTKKIIKKKIRKNEQHRNRRMESV